MIKAFIQYFPTHRCFMRCSHCFYSELKYDTEVEMPFRAIFDKLMESKLFSETPIFTMSGGEPFLREGIVDFVLNLINSIDESRTRLEGPEINITTTGYHTERIKELCDALKDSPRAQHLKMIISIDGIGAQHDGIRNTKGAFDHALESINAVAQNSKIGLQINTVIQHANMDNLLEIKNYFRPIKLQHQFIPLLLLPDKQFPYSNAETLRIFPHLDDAIYRKYIADAGTKLIKDCHAGETSLFINPDGRVFPCSQIAQMDGVKDRDAYIMGDLSVSALDDIYISERAKKARMKVKDCPGCYTHCEVKREVDFHGFDLSYHRPFSPDSNGTKSLTIFHSKGLVPNGRSYGYINMIRSFGAQLLKKGIQIKVDSPRTLHIGCPESFHPAEGGTESLQRLFSMFESDKWPPNYVKHCNYFKQVIVPCEHNAKALKNSGCEAQIAICPLGYDDELIKYERKVYIWGKNFRILWLGAPHVRKGHEVLAKAFQTAFKPYEPIELYLKTTAAEGMPPILFNPYPKIFLDNRNLPFDKIIELYHSAHVFAFPTRGEGFGLPPLEAMAAGCLVIAPAIQGLVHFVNKHTAWPLEWSMKPTPPEVIEVRTAPLVDWRHLAKLLRKAYEHYEATLPWRERGAAFVASNFTWSRSADRLMQIIYGGN